MRKIDMKSIAEVLRLHLLANLQQEKYKVLQEQLEQQYKSILNDTKK